MKAIHVAFLLLAGSICASAASAQTAASATWSLNSTTLQTGSASGLVTASDEVISVGPAPAISVFDYAGTGQRLWAGNTGWIAGAEEATRFIEFQVTPVAGNDFTVTNISFEYGAAGTANTIVSNARYSADGGTTWTLLNPSQLNYQNPSLAFLNMPVSVPVTGSFLLRIHPWAIIDSTPLSPTFATHNSVSIQGTTAPADPCVLLCNIDFEEFTTPITTFGQLDQNGVSCWNTTASDGLIEIWHDGYGSIDAFTGDFFAEINATQTATLFQTFQAVAGREIVVSFAHRGRYANADEMTVTIGPNAMGGFDNLGTYSDDSSDWGYYTIPYTLPITGAMELRFNSISSNGGTNPDGGAGGNFLDAISIGCPGGICGIKFNDIDGDGLRGAAEPGLADWTFELSGDATGTTLTDATGSFCFNDLGPGNYLVSEVSQTDWVQTAPAAPGTFSVDLVSGQEVTDLIFGNQATVPTITLSGAKFNDLNENGVHEVPGEDWVAPLPAVTINATVFGSSTPSATAVTDANGNFSMTVPQGPVYIVSEVMPTGYVQTFPPDSTYTVSTSLVNLHFGNRAGGPSEICGLKFEDLDGDGIQDAGEAGLPDWTFELSGTSTASAISDDKGAFCFNGLAAGQYTVAEVDQDGWIQTAPAAPGTFVVDLAAGESVQDLIFGNQIVPEATCKYLCNTDFEDVDVAINDFDQIDQDDVQCWSTTAERGEIEIWEDGFGSIDAYSGDYFAEINASEIATLYQSFLATQGEDILVSFAHRGRYALPDSMSVSIGPDANGDFEVLGVFGDDMTAWGYYSVAYTFPISGQMELRFNAISSNGGTNPFGGAGGNFLDAVSIGCPGGICGVKFDDLNGNGLQDPSEPGLPNWQFDLTGAAEATTLTDSKGAFCFADLAPGSYLLSEVNQNGWIQTAPAAPGTYSVEVTSGETTEDLLFGNMLEPVISGECLEEIPTEMVGWWAGDGNASDLSGFQNNGTLVGGATYSGGKVSSAFTLPNSGDFVSIPDDSALNFGTEDFSIDAWVKTTDDTNVLNIVDKRTGSGSNLFGYGLYVSGGKLAIQMGDGQSPLNFISTAPSISDGNWHFVAVTVERKSMTGGKMYVDNNPVDTFNPTAQSGSVTNTAPLYLGQRSPGLGSGNAFSGQIDEVEIFNRALTALEISSIFAADGSGKCKEACSETPQELSLNTGFDHTMASPFQVGGNDAFWSITQDADTTRTTPRPAEVVTNVTAIWPAALGNSQWIGPSQVDIDNNSIGFEQDNVGLGTYTYALELCIVGETATELTFNLLIQADNSATVWLRLPNGSRVAVGATPANGFSTPTPIVTTLTGTFPPGTYTVEVDVLNDGVSPDFTGMNLTGSVTGANLYLQKHECCNSSGKVTGTKFEDVNGNGSWDEGELPLSGVTIQLLQGNTVVATTTTDGAGDYFFDIEPGTYTVREVVPMGYTATVPSVSGYPVTLGPGQIVPNLDFGNKLIPCIETTAVFKCNRVAGGRYIELTLTNNGTVPASGVVVASATPGVTFTVTNSPAFPLAVGGSVVLNIDYAGLALGASAQMHISLYGMPDGAGMTEACCQDTVTVTRPGRDGRFDCPIYVSGEVVFDHVDAARPVDVFVVRLRDKQGTNRTTMTDDMGAFLFESLPMGEFTLSVDLPFDLRMVEPAGGFMSLSLRESDKGLDDINFVVRDSGSGTGSETGESSIPTEYVLETNYPNPFNPSTVIRYQIPEAVAVRLEVVDMLGRVVSVLVDQVQSPGKFNITFDAAGLSSGMYLYRLSAGTFVQTKRMLLIR